MPFIFFLIFLCISCVFAAKIDDDVRAMCKRVTPAVGSYSHSYYTYAVALEDALRINPNQFAHDHETLKAFFLNAAGFGGFDHSKASNSASSQAWQASSQLFFKVAAPIKRSDFAPNTPKAFQDFVLSMYQQAQASKTSVAPAFSSFTLDSATQAEYGLLELNALPIDSQYQAFYKALVQKYVQIRKGWDSLGDAKKRLSFNPDGSITFNGQRVGSHFYDKNTLFGEFANTFDIGVHPISEVYFQAAKFLPPNATKADTDRYQRVLKVHAKTVNRASSEVGKLQDATCAERADLSKFAPHGWDAYSVYAMIHALIKKLSTNPGYANLVKEARGIVLEHTQNDSIWGTGSAGSQIGNGKCLLGLLTMASNQTLRTTDPFSSHASVLTKVSATGTFIGSASSQNIPDLWATFAQMKGLRSPQPATPTSHVVAHSSPPSATTIPSSLSFHVTNNGVPEHRAQEFFEKFKSSNFGNLTIAFYKKGPWYCVDLIWPNGDLAQRYMHDKAHGWIEG